MEERAAEGTQSREEYPWGWAVCWDKDNEESRSHLGLDESGLALGQG